MHKCLFYNQKKGCVLVQRTWKVFPTPRYVCTKFADKYRLPPPSFPSLCLGTTLRSHNLGNIALQDLYKRSLDRLSPPPPPSSDKRVRVIPLNCVNLNSMGNFPPVETWPEIFILRIFSNVADVTVGCVIAISAAELILTVASATFTFHPLINCCC